MATSLRWDLLPAILERLPRQEAETIGLMDPLDYLTHVETYAAVRRNGVRLDDLLIHDFIVGLLGYLENDVQQIRASQRRADDIKRRRLEARDALIDD